MTAIAVIGMSLRFPSTPRSDEQLVLEATWHALESANIPPGSTTDLPLLTVDQACLDLAAGERTLALAGGLLDGGCGIVVLSTLDVAIANGHKVFSVIQGSIEGGVADLINSIVPAETRAPARVPKDAQLLLTLSACSDAGLRALADDYADLFDSGTDAESLCRTANRARATLPERLAVVGATEVELSAALRRVAAGDDSRVSRGRADQPPKVAFLFAGRGSQYLGMGGELYLAEPVFQRRMDECDEILRPYLDASIIEVVFGADAALLDDPRIGQPALVSVELALVALWRHWGVEPDFVAGHDVGEVAAAVTAGIMDLEAALHIAAHQLRRPVRFADALRRLAELGADTFVEISPAPVLTSALDFGTWLPSLRARREDTGQIRESLGELFTCGVGMDLTRLDDHRPGTLVSAPLYPFDRSV
jgi:acyl transferase domain-containing protein